MNKSYLKITERDIAKMLVSRIPLDFKSSEFLGNVEAVIKAIRKMPKLQQSWLKCAYIFSRKAPKQEREDLFQELTLKLLENRPKNESWAYTIARTDWIDWYRHYKVKSQYSQIDIENIVAQETGFKSTYEMHEQYDKVRPLNDGMDEFKSLIEDERAKHYQKQSYHVAVETLTGLLEYEMMDNKAAAAQLYEKLPDVIKRIANKRMIGVALTNSERVQLCNFLKRNHELVEQYRAM